VAQMSLAEHHDMIKAFAPNRTAPLFSMSILPFDDRFPQEFDIDHGGAAQNADKRRQ
jgi:hypothetical protein